MLKIIFGLAMTSALVVFKREFSSEITKTLLYKLAHLIKKDIDPLFNKPFAR